MRNQLHLSIILFFLILFLLRIMQIGGLDPTYRDQELKKLAENFKPIQLQIAKKVDALLPSPQSGLLSGILIGYQANLPHQFTQALKNTSTIHIVVVSGENLTLLAGFIMTLAPFLGRKKTLAFSLIVVLVYSAITGLQIPVLRAALMVLIASIAQFFDREAEGLWLIFLAGAAMLLYNPNLIFSISFQLSMMATIAVMVVAPEIIKMIHQVPNFVREDLGVSLSAQLLTWPIIAANFNQVSLIGPVSNVFVLWTIPLIMISGALTLAIAFINSWLGSVAALVPGVLLTYFVAVISFFNQSWASIAVPNLGPVVWVGYYILVFGLFLIIKRRNELRIQSVE